MYLNTHLDMYLAFCVSDVYKFYIIYVYILDSPLFTAQVTKLSLVNYV